MSKIQLTNIQNTVDWYELNANQQEKIIGGYAEQDFLRAWREAAYKTVGDGDEANPALKKAYKESVIDDDGQLKLKNNAVLQVALPQGALED